MVTASTGSGFGSVRQLPSGRYQARYVGPDGKRRAAHLTFDTKKDARAWLAAVRTDIVRETWRPASAGTGPKKAVTFGDFAEQWLPTRRVKGRPLADRTTALYRRLLDQHILPTFGDVPLKLIDSDDVDRWYALTAVGHPTAQAHAYGLLRTILATAVDRRLIPHNPARVTGGGSVERAQTVSTASLDELAAIVAALPDRYRLMALLASWCALRFGELTELRRSDVKVKTGVIEVRRAVVRVDGEFRVKPPKSRAGLRDVAIPPHLMPLVAEHLLRHTQPGPNGLLFPARGGDHLMPSSLHRVFARARTAAGRPDLKFHHLRHTGATLAAQTGATLAELMSRLGHSTPSAAMRYQHAAAQRDIEIARRLSTLAGSQPGV